MNIAFLNLCHCDPNMVARVAKKLTAKENFYMFIHVDQKSDQSEFETKLESCERVFFTKKRYDVSWGSFSAIRATLELMKEAVSSNVSFDRYVLLQNLDYPLKSNTQIEAFFTEYSDKEFIRACKIGQSKDRHFQGKYKLYHDYEDKFYRSDKSVPKKLIHGVKKIVRSIPRLAFDGVIKEDGKEYPLYYGAAQWALTDECVRYILDFADSHPGFNAEMEHIQFPDEEYFHTIVHNSDFKYRCIKYDEPEKRWLVNWRNIHYFEYPAEITVFETKDFDKLIQKEELFCRKVRTGVSDELMDLIDQACNENG